MLAARKSGAALADDRVITVLQFANELVGIRRPGGGNNLVVAGVRLSVGDVFMDGGAEENGVLENDPDLPTQRLATISLDIDPINENGPSLRFIEPQEQTDQCGLARPGDAHQGHSLARRNRKRNIFQNVPAVSVIKRDVVEDDLSPEAICFDGVRAVLDFRLDVEDLGDAVRAGHGLGEVGRELGQTAKRLVQIVQIRDDQNEFTGQHPLVEDLERAEQHRRGRSQRRDDLRGSGCGRFQPGDPDALLQSLGRHRVEFFLFIFLAGKGLHQRDRREHLGHAGGHLALLALLLFDRGLGFAIKMKQAETQERHRGQGNQTDLPVQRKHDGEHSEDLQGLRSEL